MQTATHQTISTACADAIRGEMAKQNLTQLTLGQKCGYKSHTGIANLLAGGRKFSAELASKIEEAFGWPSGKLMRLQKRSASRPTMTSGRVSASSGARKSTAQRRSASPARSGVRSVAKPQKGVSKGRKSNGTSKASSPARKSARST